MLEGASIVGDVVVVIVGVSEEVGVGGEDVARAQVRRGQSSPGGVVDLEDVLGVAGHVSAGLVAEVGVGVAIAGDLDRVVDLDGAMIGGEDHTAALIGQSVEQLEHDGMLKPRAGQAAVSGRALGQLTDHLTLGTGMREHVDKVDDNNVELVAQQVVEAVQDTLAVLRFVDLVVREVVAFAEAVDLGLDQRLLVRVLALLALLVDPEIGKHLGDLCRHEAGEDGVAGILGGGGEDAVVHLFVHREAVRKQRPHDAPLVEAEVVDEDEEDLLASVEQGEDLRLEKVGTHQRSTGRIGHPAHVILADELAEGTVSLPLLHDEHFLHGGLVLLEFDLPIDEFLVDLRPVVGGEGVVDLHADATKLLLIALGGGGGDDVVLVEVLFDGEEQLVGVDRLDKVVGNPVTDSLIHDALLLALGDHDDGHGGVDLLDGDQGFESGESGHILIEEDEVKSLFATAVDSVLSADDGRHVVAFLFEEEDVRLEEVDLVVSPEDLVSFHKK